MSYLASAPDLVPNWPKVATLPQGVSVHIGTHLWRLEKTSNSLRDIKNRVYPDWVPYFATAHVNGRSHPLDAAVRPGDRIEIVRQWGFKAGNGDDPTRAAAAAVCGSCPDLRAIPATVRALGLDPDDAVSAAVRLTAVALYRWFGVPEPADLPDVAAVSDHILTAANLPIAPLAESLTRIERAIAEVAVGHRTYLTLAEAAEYCRLDPGTLSNALCRGRLQKQPGSRKVLFRRDELDRFLSTSPAKRRRRPPAGK